MERFVSPPVSQLDKLRQPLTDGERLVFDFFHAHLSVEWEIYIQPHLNGLRPDFVLLNPRVGIAVFEVKDWNFAAMHYEILERPGKAPILKAKKDGKEFFLQRQNPVEKICQYKQELHNLYCPRLEGKQGFAAITAGVIFPYADDSAVRALFKPSLIYRNMAKYPEYNPLSGRNAIQSGNLYEVFPEGKRTKSMLMTEDHAKDLRNWLVEPEFAASQRQSLEFDSTQLSFVKTRTTSGYRRIKGPAGSGKSLILAARAAELLGEGKRVLVVTYNITLLHYLMDVAVRWPQSSGRTRKDITWLNFHLLCKRICLTNDSEEKYKSLNWSDNSNHVLNVDLPNLVASIIDSARDNAITKYDAILVDEGQDFLPLWWNVLRRLSKKNCEMLLVADATQDIYETASSWTDEAMTGAGFPGGRWAELKTSYRMPNEVIEYAKKFAEKYLPRDSIDIPNAQQSQLNLFPSSLKWVHTNPQLALKVCCSELFDLCKDADPDIVAIPDITFLSDNTKIGLDIVKELGNKGVKACHTYSNDSQESRRKKMGFYMGDARIKATTLHSFKGWESRALVIFISGSVDKKALALIYTGLTRLKRHTQGSYLTVVSCEPKLIDYAKTWPVYIEQKTAE